MPKWSTAVSPAIKNRLIYLHTLALIGSCVHTVDSGSVLVEMQIRLETGIEADDNKQMVVDMKEEAKWQDGDEQGSGQLENENSSASEARPVCASVLEGDHIILHPRYALLIPLREGYESEQQEEAELDPGVEKQMQHIGQTVPEKQRSHNGGGDSDNAPASSRRAAGSYSPTGRRYIPNRWTSWSLNQKFGFQQHPDHDSPVVVGLKVRGLPNKLHVANFDSISDQIITWANKSERERDGRTLIQVIRLVFEKALDEEMWSRTYGRLCRKMMEQISPKVQDESIKNAEGKPIAGGQLFRKYLINRCQEAFERGWEVTGDATKPVENKSEDGTTCGHVLYSDEYCALRKTKWRGLGHMKFLAELFMLQMLTQRIMHECVKKLLDNIGNQSEEEISSLCILLSAAGHVLDTNKARAHMDVYFSRMKDLARNENVNSRMKILLLVRIF